MATTAQLESRARAHERAERMAERKGTIEVADVTITCPHCEEADTYKWADSRVGDDMECLICGERFSLDDDTLWCLDDPAGAGQARGEARRYGRALQALRAELPWMRTAEGWAMAVRSFCRTAGLSLEGY